MSTISDVRINGIWYPIRLTRERQFFGGREYFATVDSELAEIRLSKHIREIICDAVSVARRDSRLFGYADHSQVEYVRFSGCFLVARIPFSWE